MSSRAQMTTQSINDLPDSDFAYIEPGGSKDASGKTVPRSLRHFPIHDKPHVQNALSRAPQSPFGEKAMPAIRKAAKKFGIDVGGSDTQQTSSRTSGFFTRSYILDDISIKPGDGRTVEAYAAVFDVPSEVHDPDGSYEEVIDKAAFNRTLEHSRRSGAGFPVLFNHGVTLFGTPSERYSVPIGVSEEVKVDGNGLFTRARYHKTQAADEILEAIRDGSITSYSFNGQFKRSDPPVPRGGFRRTHAGLPRVRRMESTLREFGPGTFPDYPDAAIVSVRAEQAALQLAALPPEEFERLASFFRSGTPAGDSLGFGTSSDEGPAADDPPSGHSTRSRKAEMQARYAQFLIRH